MLRSPADKLIGLGRGRDVAALIGDVSAMEIASPRSDELARRLGGLLETAQQASGARWAAVYLWQDATLGLVTRRGDLPEGAVCDPERCALLHHVRDTGTVHATSADRREPGAPCWPADGLLPALAVPVVDDDGHGLGVLELVGPPGGESGAFPEYITPLAVSLAGQAAAAVLNLQLRLRLREAQFETVFRLSVAAEFRDTETASHIHRMSRYSAIIAERLGLDEDTVELVRFASPMHDIGKMGIPDSVLRKAGPLTEREWSIMKMHPKIGADILSGPGSRLVVASREAAAAHHERIDGKGYPYGLAGDEIPLLGRIAALGDAFDAITSDRCYKGAQSLDEGLETVRRDAGTHFDPDCVRALEAGFEQVIETRAAFSVSGDTAA